MHRMFLLNKHLPCTGRSTTYPDSFPAVTPVFMASHRLGHGLTQASSYRLLEDLDFFEVPASGTVLDSPDPLLLPE